MDTRPDVRSGSFPRRGVFRRLLDSLTGLTARVRFENSGAYWDLRYRLRGTSGAGSYGESARFKADFINQFVAKKGVSDVVDFGCGDGAQLSLLKIPLYVGVDVSPVAVDKCRLSFAGDTNKRFLPLSDYAGEQGDAAMSLDVIYHLVEDTVFSEYMARLFAAARRYVLIYSTDHDHASPLGSAHIRHRALTAYCQTRFPAFMLLDESGVAPGASPSGPRFLVFGRETAQDGIRPKIPSSGSTP